MSRRPQDDSVDNPLENLTNWMASVDDALMRGQTPPDFEGLAKPGSLPLDLPELQRLLEMLDRNLRPIDSASRPAGIDTTKTDLQPPNAQDDLPSASLNVNVKTILETAKATSDAKIGRFVLKEERGRGGFGVVFRAFDPEMDRHVALKIPKLDALLTPDVRRRFLREARAAARLDHPNLVSVFEAGEVGPLCYIASAFCEGPTLRTWLDQGQFPMKPRAAARMALALARAMEHMHGRGILHCDLKPGNIMLDGLDGQGPEVDPIPRITDFGLARLTEVPIGESTALRPWGTPPYMAPEQIQQCSEEIGPPSDIYALGAILYELLTGHPTHQDQKHWALLQAIVSEPPIPPRSHRRAIPKDLDAITLKCLEKRPNRRYPTAKALADDLERFLDRRPVSARSLGRLRKTGRWVLRHPVLATLGGMGSITLVVSMTYAVTLSRINADLDRANAAAQAALHSERQHSYVLKLALSQQDDRLGRLGPAQIGLRELIPKPGEVNPIPLDFAWHYLDRQLRRERTILGDLGPANECWVSASENLILASNVRAAGTWTDPGNALERSERLKSSRVPLEFKALPHLNDSTHWWGATLAPEGRRAAFLTWPQGDDGPSRLTILDLSRGRKLHESSWPRLMAHSIQFSADGTRLGIGVYPEPLAPPDRLDHRRIVLKTGESLGLIFVPSALELAFSPDGQRLASKTLRPDSNDRFFEFWNIPTGRLLHSSNEPITSVTISPKPGGPIATATPKGLIQLRDPKRCRLIAEMESGVGQVFALAFSNDEQRLAAGGDRKISLLNIPSKECLAKLEGLDGGINSLVFQPSSNDIILGTNTGQVVIWHTEPMADPPILQGHKDEVWGLAFSPDGQTLATVGGDNRLRLWDVPTCRERASIPGHEDWPSGLVFHPDGRQVATADFGGEVLIWDTNSGRLAHKFQAQDNRIRALAFSPDGQILATSGQKSTIWLWEAATWKNAGTLQGHTESVRGLDFSADGRLLASCSADRTIHLWEVGTRRPIARWDTPTDSTCVAFGPDGTLVASGDHRGGILLWNTADGSVHSYLPTLHAEEISALTFSPDGRVLAVAGQDHVVTLIDVETGQHHLSLSGHEGGVNALAFSPDGRTLASASHDQTVRLWWAGPGAPLNGLK